MSSNNLFTSTPVPNLKKNAIDLSHEKKLTCDMGELRVIYWDDVIPGDTFNVRSEVFIKFGPMLAPIMHRIDAFVHYFWVPYRQVFNPIGTYGGWEAFITGDAEEDYVGGSQIPYVTINDTNKVFFNWISMAGDFGLPGVSDAANITQEIDINAMPFLAYQWIYDNYYRDENLIDKNCSKTLATTLPLVGGDLNAYATTLLGRRIRCWEKDYFTSALPTAYKGLSSDVELDLDIFGDNYGGSQALKLAKSSGTFVTALTAGAVTVSGNSILDAAPLAMTFKEATQQPISATLEIMELRRAQALLRYYEAANRGGHRYVEQLLGIWGVISEDARAQIPTYLGGGKQNVQISEVMNNSQTFDPTTGVNDGVGGVPVIIDPQGTFTGKGTSVGKSNGFRQTFKEHGIIIGILSVLPRTGYCDGIEKYWRKEDKTDFFIPQLQHIGEQEIKQSEIFYDVTGSDADDVFGYTPRYSEYKMKQDRISGLFATDMDYWHCTRRFTSAPALNATFVKAMASQNDSNRIFAVVEGTDNLFVQVYNEVTALRPMSFYSLPV